MPNGQFGTRIMGGKDAASARYIFTQLSPSARHIFNENDDAVLNFLEEEGQSIEPDFYLPIIPMVLVNGAEGIGTGWSTSIPQFNVREIIENLRRLMQNQEPKPMKPWYKGYQGSIEKVQDKAQYIITGNFEIIDDTQLEITELPIGKWTRDYKEMLEEMAQDEKAGKIVENIREYHQQNRVHFIVDVPTIRQMA